MIKQLSDQHSGIGSIGFILVILLLSILSIFSEPLLEKLKHDADDAKFSSSATHFKTSVTFYHSTWNIKGSPRRPFSDFISAPSNYGFPQGYVDTKTANENVCMIIWKDMMGDKYKLTFSINKHHGWGSEFSELWGINADPIEELNEDSDVFCHYIYLGALTSKSKTGLVGSRIPMIKYSIQSGAVSVADWPFDP